MIFLGAGASAPFGIPTTTTLTKETKDLLHAKSQSLILQIEQSHYEQWHAEPNYEEILGYLTAYTNPSELRNDDYRLSFANRNPQLRNEQIRNLIDQIHSIVCKYCNQPFSRDTEKYLKPEDLESKFHMTYDPIIGPHLMYRKPEVIFSTNYDPSLELWCSKRNIKCVDGTVKTWNVEVNRKLDEGKHKEKIEEHKRSKNENYVGLVRLHGSIWTYEIKENFKIKFTTPPDLRMFSDLYHKVLQRKPCLIFPGQEENVSIGQWDELYQYFKDSLTGNCLFVGFSFRHDIFNRPILDKLRSDRIGLLGLLSPHAEKALENLLKGDKQLNDRLRDRIVVMQAELGGTDAVEQLARKWFTRALGVDYRSGYTLLNNLQDWKRTRDESYIA